MWCLLILWMQYYMLTESSYISSIVCLDTSERQHDLIKCLISAAPLYEDVPCVMEQMFFLYVSEQILHNIKQEYKRLQKRRHLDSTFQQESSCCSLDLQNQSGSALPGSYHPY